MTLVFVTSGIVAAPPDVPDAESDSNITAIEPLDSVELTDDSAESNAETADEEERDERDWGDWRVRVGALFLARSGPPAYPLNDELFFSERTINAASLDYPIGAASDISLRLPGSVVDLDFRYFGVSQAMADTGPLPGLIYNTGISYENRASLSSSLQSAELNLRREVHPSVGLLAGFRYVQFREQWAIEQDFSFRFFGVNVANDTIARNELFGLQIGSDALLYSFHRLKLEGALKAGVFGNSASSGRRYSWRLAGDHETQRYDARQGAVAFVGDINLTAGVQLTRSIALRGGYQLLWLSGVTTATDQLAASSSVTDTNGSVFFHGATVGLECGW